MIQTEHDFNDNLPHAAIFQEEAQEIIDFFFVSREIIAVMYSRLIGLIQLQIEDISGFNNRLLISYLCVMSLLAIYLFIQFIYPLGNKLRTSVVTTIKLLNMIPVGVISQIKSIREYLTEISSKN